MENFLSDKPEFEKLGIGKDIDLSLSLILKVKKIKPLKNFQESTLLMINLINFSLCG